MVLLVVLGMAFCLPVAAQVQSVPVISTVAGNGTAGFAGDGGAATSAELYLPRYVAVDAIGNVYIADFQNNRVRMVAASTGIVTTVAGNGTTGYSGDGAAATSAELSQPCGVAVDRSGNIYIADTSNNRIRVVAASTSTPFVAGATVPGYIYTIVGDGTARYNGDGIAATTAELYQPIGMPPVTSTSRNFKTIESAWWPLPPALPL